VEPTGGTVDARAGSRFTGSRTFRSLESPNLRRFFVGQAFSQSGNMMQTVAAGLLVLHITDSGVALGLVTVAQFGPLLVLAPLVGSLCDRVDRHRLLLAVNTIGAAVAALFAVVVLSGDPPVWTVFAMSAAAGLVQAIENPTRRVFLAELVPEEQIPNAVGLNASVMLTSEVVGLAVAGVLVGGVGLGVCFLANALTFAPKLHLFASMDRRSFRPVVMAGPGKRQTREGFAYAWRNPDVRVPLLLLFVVGTFGFNAHAVAVPLLAERELGGGARTATVLLASVSVGSLLGALHSARRSNVHTRSLALAAVAFGVANAALGLAPNATVAVVLALPVGYTSLLTIAGMNASVQLRTAAHMRGRVMSLVSIVLLGTSPIGGPLVGWIAERGGAPSAFALGGLVSVVAGLVVLWVVPAKAVAPVLAVLQPVAQAPPALDGGPGAHPA
jgi:MFS family permease